MDPDRQLPPPVRIDLWLWAVRLCKTRSQAGEACRSSRVRVNGQICKAARKITAGDRVSVSQANDLVRELEILSPVAKRVGAPEAARCYADHTSEEALARAARIARQNRAAPRREPGSGRPTKRQRRNIEKLMEASAQTDGDWENFSEAVRRQTRKR